MKYYYVIASVVKDLEFNSVEAESVEEAEAIVRKMIEGGKQPDDEYYDDGKIVFSTMEDEDGYLVQPK